MAIGYADSTYFEGVSPPGEISPAGSLRSALAFVLLDNVPTDVALNGDSMGAPIFSGTVFGATARLLVYRLVAPDTGTDLDVVVTPDGGSVYATTVLALNGVYQATPERTAAVKTTGSGASATQSLASAAGDWGVGLIVKLGTSSLTPAGSGTKREDAVITGDTFRLGLQTVPASGSSVAIDWTLGTSVDWEQVALVVRADPGAPPNDQLAVDTQPTVGVSTVPLGAIVIESDDPSFTGNVTLAIQSGSGSLSGTTTVAAVAGVATFNNIIITGTGAHVLRATASGHDAVDTATITVAAIALSITAQPSTGTTGVALGAITVVSNVPTSTATVTLAIQTGSGAASGTLSGAMVGGSITFTNVIITGTGAHTLRATASGHTSVDTGTISIGDGSGSAIAVKSMGLRLGLTL